MNFPDLVLDIEQLIGMELKSIRPGVEIEVVAIDSTKGRIELKNKKGVIRSRPLSELERIWAELANLKPVHVEQILSGSGSSRNQPETILANLPYIEWLNIGGKKHIVYVEHISHPVGTLKQVDAIQAIEFEKHLHESTDIYTATTIVTITDQLAFDSEIISTVLSSRAEPIAQGVYRFSSRNGTVILAASRLLDPPIPLGTYGVLTLNTIPNGATPLKFDGDRYYYFSDGQFSVFLTKSPSLV